MRYLCYIAVFIFFFNKGYAQNIIKGSVKDSVQEAVPFIAVALLKPDKKTIVKGSITDINGVFQFDQVKRGSYFIKITAIGYRDFYSDSIFVDTVSLNLPGIVLLKSGISLNEVSVVAMRRPVEFKNGNITVNIEGSPLAEGNSVYDLLSHLPGVVVDNDNITIQNRQGAKVMIDGRILLLSGSQLVNLLRSMSASTIDKIDVLKNPPVKYDASGTSGLIDIRTKKVKITGFSGSSNLSYQQGFYSNKDGGLSLNYKGRNLNLFSGINFGNDSYRSVGYVDKTVKYNGLTTELNSTIIEKYITNSINTNLGADWYIDQKNIVGMRADYSSGVVSPTRSGAYALSDTSLGYNRLVFNSSSKNTWDYWNFNFNYEHKFDSLGTRLKFSTDYSPNHDANASDLENHFYTQPFGEILAPMIFKNNNQMHSSILSGKIDFEKKIFRHYNLEAGIKETALNINSEYALRNKELATGEYVIDSLYTNKFTYSERVDAGYINLQREFKKINIQAGLRAENTNVKAVSETNQISYTRYYFNLFPVLSVDYNVSDNHNIQLSYNRRINRPNYTYFNPYRFFGSNIFSSVQGNPFLRPEYSNTFELSHTYKGRISNAISFSRVDNMILNYPVQVDSSKQTIFYVGNLAHSDNFSYNLFIQQQVSKWWNLTFNASASYIEFKGTVNDQPYFATNLQASGFISNQLLIKPTLKLEIAAIYLSPMQTGLYKYDQRWALKVAVRKTFLKDRLNVMMGMIDIFYTMVYHYTAQFQNQDLRIRGSNDTRRFIMNVSYSFGKIRAQQRQSKTNDAERRRLEH